MNRSELVEKINTALTKPLIFFCREAERALGLEKLLSNYHIACVEDSPLVDELIRQNISVFCLEKELPAQDFSSLKNKSTLELINHELLLKWIKTLTNDSFYALVFKPVKALEFKIKQIGGILLQSTLGESTQFENKLFQVELFNKLQIPMPKTKVHELGQETYAYLKELYGADFIIQLEKGHTGTGTFFIHSLEEFNHVIELYKGNSVRIAEFITGHPITINACIGHQIYIGSPQYQITGIKALNGNDGTTMGNDFGYAASLITSELRNQLEIILNTLGSEMLSKGYKGLFGIDAIIKENKIYMIEINARQTANIPFETKLTITEYADAIPLQLLHIAYFLNVLPVEYQHKNFLQLHGAQIFLRSPENDSKIIDECKNGIYRLQSDNSAYDFENEEIKDAVLFIDEEKDKPLIYQTNGYAIDDIQEAGFILTTVRKGSTKNKSEELARMQFTHQIVQDEKVAPWIIEAMRSIYKSLKG